MTGPEPAGGAAKAADAGGRHSHSRRRTTRPSSPAPRHTIARRHRDKIAGRLGHRRLPASCARRSPPIVSTTISTAGDALAAHGLSEPGHVRSSPSNGPAMRLEVPQKIEPRQRLQTASPRPMPIGRHLNWVNRHHRWRPKLLRATRTRSRSSGSSKPARRKTPLGKHRPRQGAERGHRPRCGSRRKSRPRALFRDERPLDLAPRRPCPGTNSADDHRPKRRLPSTGPTACSTKKRLSAALQGMPPRRAPTCWPLQRRGPPSSTRIASEPTKPWPRCPTRCCNRIRWRLILAQVQKPSPRRQVSRGGRQADPETAPHDATATHRRRRMVDGASHRAGA